ncbi:alpha-L-fucosidase [Botryobacter ruber]|uniref:alpha-L-fucosidase n=1 Tax=Botryobacter ruber TaxID=2171629 RepID=UPI000E0B7DCE|nr:alpha-L-fucosidase [Botryobacter ruber]
MIKLLLTVAAVFFLLSNVSAQKMLSQKERMEWWEEASFGMFIHWGVYAVPAGTYNGHQIKGIGEWIMNFAKIPVADYKAYAKEFNPTKYDADAWVRMAKDAGMKYIVITAKHHDGFALFDSKASDWDVVDATPYGKDLIKPLAEACKKHGIKLGLYYSQAQDWVHPGGTAYFRAANRGYDHMPNAAAMDAYTKANDGHWDPVQTSKTVSQYVDEVAVPQVREILTKYGEIAVLWWDTPNGFDKQNAEKLHALLTLQPNIITNDRLMKPDFPGDLTTPEQKIPKAGEMEGKYWETCMTMNDTWGYKSFDHKWKSTETLIHNLVDIASKGGNYLLNIGPKADGTFPQESVDRLKEVGAWMKVNGEAIYGTKQNPLTPVEWGRITRKEDAKGSTLYLTVFNWPADGKLLVPGLSNNVKSAGLLAGGKKVKTKKTAAGTVIELPAQAPDAIASVIKVQVKGQLPATASEAHATGMK